jgi:hypothetical protein
MVKNKFKSISTLQFIPLYLILQLSAVGGFFNANATVRYVSHEGSNTPPYTTWETAADSIMSAINISAFGDTIYVANGVYIEEVTMIRGLALIGSGIDSCVIDTRTLDLTFAVTIRDSCIFKNFKVIKSNYDPQTQDWKGFGVYLFDLINPSYFSVVELNKIQNAKKNIVSATTNSIIANNIISNCNNGVDITSVSPNMFQIVIRNYISSRNSCVRLEFGGIPYLANNICRGQGFSGSYSGLNELYNNVFINNGGTGAAFSDSTIFINNIITGSPEVGIQVGGDNQVVKNNVIENAEVGIKSFTSNNPVIQYNNFWNLGVVNQNTAYPDSTNIFRDPMFVEDTSDFHLQMFSPLIDAGDPNILDVNGSRSDIGIYGGLLGEKYSYQDLAPRPPRNLSAVVDSEYITISWNPNTEADFNSYNLFRDTTANFVADSNTFVIELNDTFYHHLIPPGIDAFYYKLTAADNQGNVSGLSEELAVIITSVNEYPTIVSNYQLYQNYPNPFNPSTKIAYKLKERGYVKLYVYDIKGELISVLVNQTQNAGYYEVEFSGKRQDGRGETLGERLASGIYIYRIDIKNNNNIPIFTDMKKMLMIK